MNNAKRTKRQIFIRLLLRSAKLLDKQNLNNALGLIFNGIASMIAIVFIVMFIVGYKPPLLLLGILGCVTMTLANVADLFPFWLKKMAQALDKDKIISKLN